MVSKQQIILKGINVDIVIILIIIRIKAINAMPFTARIDNWR